MLPGLIAIAAVAPVLVVSLPPNGGCANAQAFGAALEAGGIPVRSVVRSTPPDAAQATVLARAVQARLVAWLAAGGEQALVLHVEGPGIRPWQRRIPPAPCDVQVRAAVIATLSLLDPVTKAPETPPPPPGPPPQTPPPPETTPPPAVRAHRLAVGLVADGRLLFDGRLSGGPGVQSSLRLGGLALNVAAAGLNETPIPGVPGGGRARAFEVEARLSRAWAPGWVVGPQGGVGVDWLTLDAPRMEGSVSSSWLNPSISLGFLATWCRAGWCATATLEARAWLRREDLTVGGLGTVATTPWGALGTRLGIRREML